MPTILEAVDICAGYGDVAIIDGISLRVSPGEVVAVLGPNGSGKTTLMRAMVGIISEYGGKIRRGQVLFSAQDVTGHAAHFLARQGLMFVPEGGRVFPSLSVRDNLLIAATASGRGGGHQSDVEAAMHVFPDLKSIEGKRTVALSLGERQILALARAFIQKPRALILDEPSAGLSTDYSARVFREIRRMADAAEVGVIVVEQNARIALLRSDRAYVLKHGHNFWDGRSEVLLAAGGLESLL